MTFLPNLGCIVQYMIVIPQEFKRITRKINLLQKKKKKKTRQTERKKERKNTDN